MKRFVRNLTTSAAMREDETPLQTGSAESKRSYSAAVTLGEIQLGSVCVLTCFAHSAASNHSHFYDPVEQRALGRRTLGDRRHVVDETHGFLLGEAGTVPN